MMKQHNGLMRLLAATVIALGSASATAEVCAIVDELAINVLPGKNENTVDKKTDTTIPVLIFGSEKIDVTRLDTESFRLRVHALWEPSRVVRPDSNSRPCSVADTGSPSPFYADGIGPSDGYPDLLCQFTTDLAFVAGGTQPLLLTGMLDDGSKNGARPVSGFDSVSGPGGTLDIVRCCVDCDDKGNCYGCNGDLKNCGDFLRQCAGDEHCYDCTGCKRPDIC